MDFDFPGEFKFVLDDRIFRGRLRQYEPEFGNDYWHFLFRYDKLEKCSVQVAKGVDEKLFIPSHMPFYIVKALHLRYIKPGTGEFRIDPELVNVEDLHPAESADRRDLDLTIAEHMYVFLRDEPKKMHKVYDLMVSTCCAWALVPHRMRIFVAEGVINISSDSQSYALAPDGLLNLDRIIALEKARL